jgi:hypothetical protein
MDGLWFENMKSIYRTIPIDDWAEIESATRKSDLQMERESDDEECREFLKNPTFPEFGA